MSAGPAPAALAAGAARQGRQRGPGRAQVAAAVDEEEVSAGLAAAAVSDEAGDGPDDEADEELDDSPEDEDPAFLPPSRKSVTYQPEPFN